jgi:hypothetical protein
MSRNDKQKLLEAAYWNTLPQWKAALNQGNVPQSVFSKREH